MLWIAVGSSVLGMGLLAVAVAQRRRSLAAWAWPTARGIVRAAEVERHASGRGGAGPASYSARVRYDYVVDGQTYHGDCISDGMGRQDAPGYPDSLVLRYAPGNVAQVRHHPRDPARSVLEVHPRGAGLLAAEAGLALLAAGVVAFLIGVQAVPG